jgi:hypothetical protein
MSSAIRTIDDIRQRCEIADNCWIWTGPVMPSVNGPVPTCWHDGARIAVRRAAWLLSGRRLRSGWVVYSVCPSGESLCVNPEHCRSGERGRAMQHAMAATYTPERRSKTATQMVRAHGMRALTDEQARAVMADPRSAREISTEYRVSTGVIWRIKSGQHYRDATATLGASVFSWRPA